MSYEERGVWAQAVSFAGGYAVYLAIVVPRLLHTPAAQVSYMPPLVVTTLAAVVVATLGRSVLEFARPSDTGEADVRDREIKRFGEHAGRWCIVAGAVAGMIGANAHWAYFWIANVIWLGFVLWALAGSGFRIVAYRRGL